MAKKAKSKPASMEDLSKTKPNASQHERNAEAKLICDQNLISIFKKNLAALDELDYLNKRMEEVKKNVDGCEKAINEEVAKWFKSGSDLFNLIKTNVYLDGLREIARNDKKKSKKIKSGVGNPGGKKNVLEVLKTIQGDQNGWVDGRKVMEELRKQNMDLVCKRLKLVTGELARVNKGSDPKVVRIKNDHTFDKVQGTRSTYVLNVKSILERLESMIEKG